MSLAEKTLEVARRQADLASAEAQYEVLCRVVAHCSAPLSGAEVKALFDLGLAIKRAIDTEEFRLNRAMEAVGAARKAEETARQEEEAASVAEQAALARAINGAARAAAVGDGIHP